MKTEYRKLSVLERLFWLIPVVVFNLLDPKVGWKDLERTEVHAFRNRTKRLALVMVPTVSALMLISVETALVSVENALPIFLSIPFVGWLVALVYNSTLEIAHVKAFLEADMTQFEFVVIGTITCFTLGTWELFFLARGEAGSDLVVPLVIVGLLLPTLVTAFLMRRIGYWLFRNK